MIYLGFFRKLDYIYLITILKIIYTYNLYVHILVTYGYIFLVFTYECFIDPYIRIKFFIWASIWIFRLLLII